MKLLTDDINTYLQLYDIGINLSLIDPNPILEQIILGIQEQISESNASIEVAICRQYWPIRTYSRGS